MECENIQKKFSDYLDGLLSVDERKHADDHLKSCAECSHALEELKKTVAYTQGLEEVEPPPWLEQKVMAEVREGERRKEGFFQRLLFPVNSRFPIELLATLAIAVTALFVFRSVEPDLEKISQDQVMVQGESDGGVSSIKADEEKERFLLEKDIKELPKTAAPAKRKMFMMIPQSRDEKKEASDKPAVLAQEEMLQRDLQEEPGMKVEEGGLAFAPGAVGSAAGEKGLIDVTVYVDNFKISADRIKEMIKELKGEIVKTEHFEDKDIMTVVVDSNKISKLINELKVLGEIKEKEIVREDFD
ncbi:MAG: DUF2275 domain-containing protein, partial [Thermodesulfovibrionia bacterium]|nr:DUF2275 domain-containing protein [Thermodesulfovibrionia bacterium]